LTSREIATVGGKFTSRVHVLGLALELGQLRAEVREYVPHDLLHAVQVPGSAHPVPVPGHERQVDVQDEHAVPVSVNVLY
jgi:hypothetical protein